MKNKYGQTALILILLTAAALIFLAITLNWGRIAQVKALVTIAADGSASLMASDAASYGEMQKQTNLKDTNKITGETGGWLAILLVVLSILLCIIFPPTGVFAWALTIATIAMAIANLVLQVVVIQPGITALWNSLQKNQPIPQQFYEGGVAAALQGSVTDQVNIADYFDWNANGKFGIDEFSFSKDTVSRFAVFYTDRLKMLNQKPIPQVQFFYDQLNELMNGESCAQNESDYASYPGIITLNPACAGLDCINNPANPACQVKIPNGFQLHDACTGSDFKNTATYSPYCDPCCQQQCVPGSNPCKLLRPPPSVCPSGDSNCGINNPYGSSYPDIYDPSFQNYAVGLSFLDQFGRDQQIGPFTSLTPREVLPPGTFFPNGIYPFFWLMNDYSPEVDNINPGSLQPAQYHWCTAPAYTPPAGYLDLAQLSLPYSCSGQDCCVNYLPNSVTNGLPNPSKGTTIDMVGSPSFGPNPALDPSFAEGGSGSWLQGDSQMCSTAWPYNGADSNLPDGTCEWSGNTADPLNPAPPTPPSPLTEPPSTLDSLDDTMHTLSDFVNFAKVFLSNDVGTLSSSFSTWYPQAATWIATPCTPIDSESFVGWQQCNTPGVQVPGRLLTIYAPPGYPNIDGYDPATPVDKLGDWNTLITNWLNTVYTSNNTWCVPSEATLLNGNGSTAEDTYINSNSINYNGVEGPWGDLPHVMACLNYNSNPPNGTSQNSSVYNYTQCQSALTSCNLPTSCDDLTQCGSGGPGRCSDNSPCSDSLSGTPCDPLILGRSLVAGPVPAYDGCAGKYAAWVNDSLTLATDEAPKFALRSAFLTDIYTRAKIMPKIFQAGEKALSAFLAPCAGSNCSDGGPAAQLIWANSHPSPTSSLPNSVIYGWVDNLPGGKGGCMDSIGNRVGCAHIVKVTAYSVGRGGSQGGSQAVLPWIETSCTKKFLGICIQRSYTLVARDGQVYASVKRWDENHGNSLLFPNGHPLWQFMFHNPKAGSAGTGQDFMQACNGFTLPGGGHIGFGLKSQTVAGLGCQGTPQCPSTSQMSPADVKVLGEAFMLNDRGDGSVDPSANSGGYKSCLSQANILLANAPESHVCAQYIASRDASRPSADTASDYSVKFVGCGPESEDLTYTNGGL